MATTEKQEEPFVSKLGEGRAAFLAELCQYCLAVGERSPKDFIRHFSCEHIMLALEKAPNERASILVGATGTHEKIAPKMSAAAAGETLQIALEEELTTPEQIVELFGPDDRQRHLDDAALWAFAIEGKPWTIEKGSGEFSRAQGVIRYGLERALHHKLLDAKALVSALTVLKLTQLLPAELLAEIIEGSLGQSQKFSHQNLVDIAAPAALVEHLPLGYVWEQVFEPLIAEAHGYASAGSSESSGGESESEADEPEEQTEVEADEDLFGDEGSTETTELEEQDEVDLEVREDEIDESLDEEEEEEVHTVENEDVIDGVDTDDDDVFDEILDEGLSKSSGGPSVASASSDKGARRKVSLN